MEHAGGIFGISLAFVVTIFLVFRHPKLFMVLMSAFALRAGATLTHTFVFRLPDGISDAVGFEYAAYMWSLQGLGGALTSFGDRGLSYVYSNLGSLVYVLFGRDALMLQSLSVIAGVFSVLLTYRLAQLVWEDDRIALKAAWGVALFPVLVMYSALTMREPFIILLFLGGLIYAVKWSRSGSYLHAAAATGLFLCEVFFHAGMAIPAFLLVGFILYESVSTAVGRLTRGYIRLIPMIVAIAGLAVIAVAWRELVALNIPYIGNLAGLVDPQVLLDTASIHSRVQAGSAWPGFLVPTGVFDIIWTTPLRVLYFLFAPFPWDLRAVMHLVGLFDGLLYIVIAVYIYQNRTLIRDNRAAMVMIVLLAPLILAFAWGTGNFGTGLRHRVKLVAALLVLAAPRLPRLVFRRAPRE